MKKLYLVNPEIEHSNTYVYTTYNNATSFAKRCKVEGFITRYNSMEVVFEIHGKPVINLRQASDRGVNVVIVDSDWQVLYSEVCQFVDRNKIYVNSKNWECDDRECIMCGHKMVWNLEAKFHPFIQERMFLGTEQNTSMIFCPECGTYYSSYRPVESEINRFYSGYRDNSYQKMRQKYELGYTTEFNERISCWFDGYQDRRSRSINFLRDVLDFYKCRKILDYGGDRGQFIPDEFRKNDCYVFDISGANVLEDIKPISDQSELMKIEWDLILCMNVLSHASNVHVLIDEIKTYMTRATYLYIEIPCERIENEDELQIHEHINMFSEKIFFVLAEQHDLKIIKYSTDVNRKCLLKKRV